MDETDNYHVAVNLSRVQFISKRNLTYLMELTTRVKEAGGSIVYYNVNPVISKTLLESGLYKFVNVINNENRVRTYFQQLLSA
ncbi:MAG: STAS domain-containing protein [Vampirovibrionia bacterium]